jgi:transcriptional regulator with XRE-family HTH domain
MMPVVIGVDRMKLRRFRLGCGLTQIELANLAGVSPDTIVRWEGGKGDKPHPSSLLKVAKALDVRPADLLDDA